MPPSSLHGCSCHASPSDSGAAVYAEGISTRKRNNYGNVPGPRNCRRRVRYSTDEMTRLSRSSLGEAPAAGCGGTEEWQNRPIRECAWDTYRLDFGLSGLNADEAQDHEGRGSDEYANPISNQ